MNSNRSIITNRIQKEIIGPGSDIFICEKDYKNEIIDGKPLQRYFSGILFPKQLQPNNSDNGIDDLIDDVTDENFDSIMAADNTDAKTEGEQERFDNDEDDTTDTQPKYSSNTFFPSHFGISFCINKSVKSFQAVINFGNYKKASHEEIKLPYPFGELHLLNQFGLNDYVIFDETTKTISQAKDIKRTEKGQLTLDYLHFQDCLRSLQSEMPNHPLYKHITKLFFKDKYKRFENKIEIEVHIHDILTVGNNHLKINLSEQSTCNIDNWHKDNKDNLVAHFKLYSSHPDKYFIKAIIEHTAPIEKKKFSLSKEKLNQMCCFQTQISIQCDNFLPFRDYKPHLYKTDEDKMLDYLYQEKLAFGIGHNTSCDWEHSYSNSKPRWISSTFLPEYNVKSQSSNIDSIKGEILNIKNLSSFNNNKEQIIANLNSVANAYRIWIDNEKNLAKNNEFGLININKCAVIYQRIVNGIKLLEVNENALQAFQLANTAIYLQMYQSQKHFSEKKEGFEGWERNGSLQDSYNEYAAKPFPIDGNGISVNPEWRPFQLAFILQCISSFVEEKSSDRELVDLLYFPTGGGKTEAYLAVSAFLIFWRRIKYPTSYGGVNIIIRYTLRLLSAQQFERATKLILACEFIRQNNKELGNERISIGFWIGTQTIPNTLEEAKRKLDKAQEKLNKGDSKVLNPFQLSNCQWCNSKIVSKINQNDGNYQIGHRIDTQLKSYCLNHRCNFSESKGGLPIVLIDEDIYTHPPTILFATVDKFAMLAWKGEANSLFNNNLNRKPELIIQDELHLLNGTLGSLVGLFENSILALCTNENQSPKIIASTATIKNVDKQILGLYGRKALIFPQYATNSDDTFFSKVIDKSKRKYIGILPTGKTTVTTNLQLLAALLFARLEVWKLSEKKEDADQFWTILSYFKSLKEIGRFSNKINAELKPIIKQLQIRFLIDDYLSANNYLKISYRNIELTSRIPNEKIKKNLDKLEIAFDGDIQTHDAYDLVLATNMISVGLDVSRLGIMVMNGMPPNTAEYIQASSRVARKDEGLVITLYDPLNSRDLSFYEDFIQFHKTFYKQVEPLSITPFAENALDKMLFTMIIAFFRHSTINTLNNMANALQDDRVKNDLKKNVVDIFKKHELGQQTEQLILQKIENLLLQWSYRIDAQKDLKYYWKEHQKESLMTPLQDKNNEDDILTAMQSMRSVEPNSEILIKQY